MPSITLPCHRRSPRIARQRGYLSAQELASVVESTVKNLADLRPSDVAVLNGYCWWDCRYSLYRMAPLLTPGAYTLLESVFYVFSTYMNALCMESMDLLTPAEEKMKELLKSVVPGLEIY
jgi:hypothetical protein